MPKVLVMAYWRFIAKQAFAVNKVLNADIQFLYISYVSIYLSLNGSL